MMNELPLSTESKEFLGPLAQGLAKCDILLLTCYSRQGGNQQWFILDDAWNTSIFLDELPPQTLVYADTEPKRLWSGPVCSDLVDFLADLEPSYLYKEVLWTTDRRHLIEADRWESNFLDWYKEHGGEWCLLYEEKPHKMLLCGLVPNEEGKLILGAY